MTFTDFQRELNDKIKYSKHHCYGMFMDAFVEDFGFGNDTFNNAGNLHVVYKNGSTEDISLNKDEIEKAERYVVELTNKKVLIKPILNPVQRIIKDISNQLFISEEEYDKIPKYQTERSSDFHKCKGGYYIQKDKLSSYYIPGGYNVKYIPETRSLTENDLFVPFIQGEFLEEGSNL